MFKEWDQLSEKEQLLQYISDEYKRAYGLRPRGKYDHLSVEELKAELDRLNAYANEQYELEQAQAEQDADEFDARVEYIIESGAGSRAKALQWILEADEADFDMEFFVYKQGFLFTERGRALADELWKLQKEVV
tara:strand:+ start:1236 stop:1637 length:402 start_codon:yes stop_codon:yes gene_type:complete